MADTPIPPGALVAPGVPVAADVMPPPRPFHRLLRDTNLRWLRVPVNVLVAVMTWLLCVGAVDAVLGVVAARTGSDQYAEDSWNGMLYGNLVLAAAIPAVLLARRLAFGRRVGRVSSVVGRLRGGWLVRCVVLCVVAGLVAYGGIGVFSAFVGGEETPFTPEPDWLGLTVVVLLTTPLQAAAEEFVFRGWMPQLFGAVIPHSGASLLIGGAVSTTLFVAAHGSTDLWICADLFVFGAVALWLTWRTGGLEAAIALHVVNNLIVFGLSIPTSDVAEAATQAVDSSWSSFLVGLIPPLLAAALIVRAARHRRVARLRPVAPRPVHTV